jgi:hypothetical protein
LIFPSFNGSQFDSVLNIFNEKLLTGRRIALPHALLNILQSQKLCTSLQAGDCGWLHLKALFHYKLCHIDKL